MFENFHHQHVNLVLIGALLLMHDVSHGVILSKSSVKRMQSESVSMQVANLRRILINSFFCTVMYTTLNC